MSSASRDSLRTLSPADSVRVDTAEDGVLFGSFVSVDGDALVLTVAGDTDAEVPLDAIVRVTRNRYDTRRGTTIGVLAGAVPLLLLGWAAGYFTIALIFAAIFALVLGTIGALIGGLGGAREVVYEEASR